MKKKRILALTLSVLLIISTITGITVFAENNNAWAYDSDTKTLTINSNTEDYTENDYTSSPWYAYKDETENIIIQSGVTSIGDFSFCFESNVRNVTLPDTLENIGTGAFAGCDSLKQITVPESVTAIGDYAFGYDSQMQLTQDFIAICAANSFAQNYCFKNYIMFDTPVNMGENTAVITTGNAQYLQSFVPKTDCTITFKSVSESDTYGLIYDAQTYEYSDNFSLMSKSAIIQNDDDSIDEESLNFSITVELSKGRRYYLASKYKYPKMTGTFNTEFSLTCTHHIYEETVITPPSCETDGMSIFTCIGCGDSYENKLYALGHDYALNGFDGVNATVKCTRCDSEYNIRFMDYYNSTNNYLDVVTDSVVNAKDYAKLAKDYK